MRGLQKAQLTAARPEQHEDEEQMLGNRGGYGKTSERSPGISAPPRLMWFSRLLQVREDFKYVEIFKPCLDKFLSSLLWVTLLQQEVGLGDPQRSLPTPAFL